MSSNPSDDDNNPCRHLQPSLAGLVGQRLDSVGLVAGYATLCRGENHLNVHAAALNQSVEGHARPCPPGYADRLRALAGQELVNVDELLDRGPVLTFANSTRARHSLGNDGTDGNEAADPCGGAIWDAGVPPFD